MIKKIIIIGASGHGKVVADIASKNGYRDIRFLDDDISKIYCGKYEVIGNIDSAVKYSDCDFIVAIGNADIRCRILDALIINKLHVVKLVHPSVNIGDDVQIGIGTVVMAGAVINSSTKIRKGCIINTAATIDHDNYIDDYVHISVGSHLAGMVTIGKKTWVGIGAVVSNNISICNNCIIGAGAVVVKDIDRCGTYVGIPATEISSFKNINRRQMSDNA